jgi:hypothetical protein
MKALRLLFPVGTFLTVGGVILYVFLENLSPEHSTGSTFDTLLQVIFPALLIGTLLAIIGSFVERRHLSVIQAKLRGAFCIAVSVISFLLFYARGNVHNWTFTLIFPAFVGLVSGLVFLSRMLDSAVRSDPKDLPDKPNIQ